MAYLPHPEMLQGNYVNLREVTLDDAAFILSLRTNPKKSQFLHVTGNNLQKQIDYLKHYFTLEKEWYFIIENKYHCPLGTIRIYNVKNTCFTGGSWIMIDDATPKESIEGDLLLKQYAFEVLGFTESIFDVRKKNIKVVRYHKMCGAEIIDENDSDYIFKSTRVKYLERKKSLFNILEDKNMLEDDLISIGIAAYNHQDFIEETIVSCIKQTYKNLELVIIDDGSTDLTFNRMCELREICEKRFVRTVFLTQSNVGIVETCNRLQQIYRGKYVFGISSDDVIANKNAITILHSFLYTYNYFVLVSGQQDYIDNNSNPIHEKRLPSGFKKCTRRDSEYMKNLFIDAYGDLYKDRADVTKVDYLKYSDFWFGSPIPNGYLIKKSYIDKITKLRNINTFNLEDFFMHLQLTKYGKYKVLKDNICHYRVHNNNYTISNWERNAIETRGVWFYEHYLLETEYPDYNDKDCLKAPNFINTKKEWEICKKSKFWDETYYVNCNTQILDQGYIPLVHYLSWGVAEGKSPCKIFECIPIKKNTNIILWIEQANIKKRFLMFIYLNIFQLKKKNKYLFYFLYLFYKQLKHKLINYKVLE